MSEHLSAAVLNAVVDGELEGAELVRANEHLKTCAACSSQCLSYGLLKRRVAEVVGQYELPRGFAERMQRVSAGAPARQGGWARWAAVAALVLVCVGAVVMQRVLRERAEQAAVVGEVVDEHIATLAANAPPEVISTDRHTVKPWFQGKLPFSFNLPATLPAGTTLDGANLTYIGGRPVAQLLFSIGKHRASVFVEQIGGAAAVSKAERAGFHVASFRKAELVGVAVSDAEPARVAELAQILKDAQ
jgi:anti-sigma factor RsiW